MEAKRTCATVHTAGMGGLWTETSGKSSSRSAPGHSGLHCWGRFFRAVSRAPSSPGSIYIFCPVLRIPPRKCAHVLKLDRPLQRGRKRCLSAAMSTDAHRLIMPLRMSQKSSQAFLLLRLGVDFTTNQRARKNSTKQELSCEENPMAIARLMLMKYIHTFNFPKNDSCS
jgi:hypothetical protein